MNDIEKAIELLKTINQNMKVDHMTKDMWDGVTEEETREYIEDFGLINLAISALEKHHKNDWIPVSERLPQLPDGKSFIPLNVTILAPSGLRNTVQMTWELKRGNPTWCYLGETSDWNVIAWQSLPEPYKEEV